MIELTNQTTRIPLNQINIGPNPTPRHTEQSVRELADSIKQKGMLQPIAVRPVDNGYVQIYGEGRLRALKLLANEGAIGADQPIEVVVKNVGEQEAYILALAENDLRNEVAPLMRAESYQKLVDSGMSIDVIAKRLGKRLSFVSEHLALASLSGAAKDYLAKGEITLERAMLLSKISHEQQENILKEFGPNYEPKVVKGMLAKGHFLTKYAIFDKNTLNYQPALDPDAEFFLDKDQAIKCQLEALALLKEQKQGYNFVEICPGDRFLEHYYKADDDGLVLAYNPLTYEVREVPASRKESAVPLNVVKVDAEDKDQDIETEDTEVEEDTEDTEVEEDDEGKNAGLQKAHQVNQPAPRPPSKQAQPVTPTPVSPSQSQPSDKRPLSYAGYDTLHQLKSKRLQQSIINHPDALTWAMRLTLAGMLGYSPVKISKAQSASVIQTSKSIEYWRNPLSSQVMTEHKVQSLQPFKILEWVMGLSQADLEKVFIHITMAQVVSERSTPAIKGPMEFEKLVELFGSQLEEQDLELLYDYMSPDAANQTLQSLKPNHRSVTKKEAISLIKIAKKPQGWIPPFLS